MIWISQCSVHVCTCIHVKTAQHMYVYIHLIEALMKRIARAVVQDQRILDLSVSSSLNDLSGTQPYLDFLWMNVKKKFLIVNTGSDTFDYCQKSNLPADAGYVISALSATVGSIYHIWTKNEAFYCLTDTFYWLGI